MNVSLRKFVQAPFTSLILSYIYTYTYHTSKIIPSLCPLSKDGSGASAHFEILNFFVVAFDWEESRWRDECTT